MRGKLSQLIVGALGLGAGGVGVRGGAGGFSHFRDLVFLYHSLAWSGSAMSKKDIEVTITFRA